MKNSTLIAGILLMGVCTGFAQTSEPIPTKQSLTNQTTPIAIPTDQLKAHIRQLWEDRVTLTRNVILSEVDNEPGIDDDVTRMKANQVELGNAIKAYYGDYNGKQFTKLLNENITIGADLMIAARRGHTTAFDNAEMKWKQNANAICMFLNEVNPFWKVNDMRAMMYGQILYAADEITALKNNDPQAEEQAYTKAYFTTMTLADMFSDGIIMQFPQRFQDFTISIGMR